MQTERNMMISLSRLLHAARCVVPAVVFFIVFFLLFLWSYLHPGMMILASGAVNLFILVLIVVGSLLNLAASAVMMAFLARRNPADEGDPNSAS